MNNALVARLEAETAEERQRALTDAADLTSEQLTQTIQSAVLERFNDADPRMRFHALEAISHWAHRKILPGDTKFLYAARRAASDDHPRVRSEAAVALVLIEDPPSQDTISVLLKLLNDEHPRVRQEAAAALGDAQSKPTVEALSRHIEDEDPQTRFEVCFALASLGDARGLPGLLDATGSSKRRLDALEGIRRLKDPSALTVLRPLSERFFLGWPERLTVYATMYCLGDPSAAGVIIERAQSRNKSERSLALGLIGTHKVIEAKPLLYEILQDPTHTFRVHAINALVEMGEDSLVPLLREIIDDTATSDEVRTEAQHALKRMCEE